MALFIGVYENFDVLQAIVTGNKITNCHRYFWPSTYIVP